MFFEEVILLNGKIFNEINEEYLEKSARIFDKYEEEGKYSNQKKRYLGIFFYVTLGLIILTYCGIYIKKDQYKMYKILDSEKVSREGFFILLLLGLVIVTIYIFITMIHKRLQLEMIYYYYTNEEKEIIKHKKITWRTKKSIFNMQYIFPSNRKDILTFLFSPDYFYSNRNKEQLKEFIRKIKYKDNEGSVIELIGKRESGLTNYDWLRISIERKFLVEWSNWSNVKRSVVYFLLVITLYFLLYFIAKSPSFDPEKSNNLICYIALFISGMIIFRVISRGIEVVYAFYKDVVRVDSKSYIVRGVSENNIEYRISEVGYINGFKSSLLRSQGRLSLAIHSLIEFFILFSAIYIILSTVISGFWGKTSVANPLHAILYSFSLGVFNVSFDQEFIPLRGFLHAFQLLTSCVLILLSVSHYLNGNNEMDKGTFEYKFYNILNKVKLEKNRFLYIRSRKISDIYIWYDNEIEGRYINKNEHEFISERNNAKCIINYNGTVLTLSNVVDFKIEIRDHKKMFLSLK